MRVCSHALMRFLDSAVLRLKPKDSLSVSKMWRWCVRQSSSAVVHHRGMLSAITAEWRLGWLGIRTISCAVC